MGRKLPGTRSVTEWSWRGEDAALQLDVQSGVVESQEYPNAFERIAGALDATNSGDVDHRGTGCEFELPGGVAHVGGGSHGALHALDSLSPVVIGGAGASKLPRTMRVVDIAPLCLQLLVCRPGMRLATRASPHRTAPDAASSTSPRWDVSNCLRK